MSQQLTNNILCVECGDQPAEVKCQQCEDNYCTLCFLDLHRKGVRSKHQTTRLLNLRSTSVQTPSNQSKNQDHITTATITTITTTTTTTTTITTITSTTITTTNVTPLNSIQSELDHKDTICDDKSNIIKSDSEWLRSRCRYIPVRLTELERHKLSVLLGALEVSEYTDKVDIISYNKSSTIVKELKTMCHLLLGLTTARSVTKGSKLVQDRGLGENQAYLAQIFEIGRRHKIRNPEKMRSAYGKLMYMLMDSVRHSTRRSTSVNLMAPIKTVYSFLQIKNCMSLLDDELLSISTSQLIVNGQSRQAIKKFSTEKKNAFDQLCKKYVRIDEKLIVGSHVLAQFKPGKHVKSYPGKIKSINEDGSYFIQFDDGDERIACPLNEIATVNMTEEDIKLVVNSILDSHSFLASNQSCVDIMINYLQTLYHPSKSSKSVASLSIWSGRNGSRLTHSHSTQYQYVLESLSLWRDIMHDMFRLWCLTDADMLDDGNGYSLRNTGQGLNRIQGAGRIRKAMSSIIRKCADELGGWVGSSVVHLGDRDVPNGLMFIDKYNQVPRILNPIVNCLKQLERLYKEKSQVRTYLDHQFGSYNKCRETILTSFFKHGFNGSGADNDYDAGSCIDGRLTSAWNWCSLLEKKSFYGAFLLTGFRGFDGAF